MQFLSVVVVYYRERMALKVTWGLLGDRDHRDQQVLGDHRDTREQRVPTYAAVSVLCGCI